MVSVLIMQTSRQLPTTAGHGSCTFLVVFCSPTGRETPRHGCTCPVLLTGTRRGATARVPQCWGTCTGSFARLAVGVRQTLQYEDVFTCFSFGCGLVYRSVGPKFLILVPGSRCMAFDVGRHMPTFGTRLRVPSPGVNAPTSSSRTSSTHSRQGW